MDSALSAVGPMLSHTKPMPITIGSSRSANRDGFLDAREWNFSRTRRASRNGALAVKLGVSGDVTDTHVLWCYESRCQTYRCPSFTRTC